MTSGSAAAQQSVTFQTSPWLIALSFTAFAVCLALSWIAMQRSGFQRGVVLLESLRCGVVALAALLLNQPEWIEDYRSVEKPTLAVLIDRSSSMQTRDVVEGAVGQGNAITRAEAVEALESPEFWKVLSDRAQVTVTQFPADGSSDGTDLATPLNSAIENSANLMGVLVVSDGDWNAGEPPASVASRYRTLGVPVIGLPIGAPTRLPDVELLSVDTPTFGIINKGVRVPFTIDSSLPRDTTVQVAITSSDGERLTKEVRVRAMARTTDAVVWTPKKEGDFTLQVDVPVVASESITNNNSLTAPISIRQEKLKVLVVDTYPRWEYRYLRNALSRDPGIEVSCLLFHPDLEKVGGGNRDYIKAFPESIEELATYDVVFLGDVGVAPGQLTEEQCKLIKGLVEFQAAGLVFIPGARGYEHSLAQTELESLLPVVLDEGQPEGIGTRTPMRMELTESGRRSLLTKLADTQEENVDVWMELPGFQWHASVLRAKAGAEVLAVHESASGTQGRMPLLVTKTFGTGKILFMGTDGVWRWRRGVEDKYHYRFWGQVVRWMAYQRNMAKGESMRFFFSPDSPSIGQTITLRANVMQASGEPLAEGDVTARIESPSGKVDVVRLSSGGDESWGAFEGRYTADEPGSHRVTLFCKQTSESLETSFFVQGASRERIGQAARPKVLEELARLTGGQVLSLAERERWFDALRAIPEPPSTIRRVPLWSHPATVGILLVALTAFWIGRKAIGMV
ncbi:MAG: hypothetical protein MUF23_00545 [Pirellula sp.]|nr:hypothetical protein [Pirellula sp.]